MNLTNNFLVNYWNYISILSLHEKIFLLFLFLLKELSFKRMGKKKNNQSHNLEYNILNPDPKKKINKKGEMIFKKQIYSIYNFFKIYIFFSFFGRI